MKKILELFDQDNLERKRIEFQKRDKPLPNISVGEIWRYYIGVNIGQEISKGYPFMRPCIILSKIKNTSLIRIVPLTTKRHQRYNRYLIMLQGNKKHKMKSSWLAIHHITSVDKKRLIKRQGNKRVSERFCQKIYFQI